MHRVARDAERLQIIEMVDAVDLPVPTLRGAAMIDFETANLALRAPNAHRLFIGRLGAMPGPRRAFWERVPALRAPIFIAQLCRPPGKRPPVVFPERLPAAIATPGATPLREARPAPSTSAKHALGKGAVGEQRGTLAGSGWYKRGHLIAQRGARWMPPVGAAVPHPGSQVHHHRLCRTPGRNQLERIALRAQCILRCGGQCAGFVLDPIR